LRVEEEGTELQIAKETQKTGWYVDETCPSKRIPGSESTDAVPRVPYRKINTSPTTIDDKDSLKKFLTTPPVNKIGLHFPTGIELVARNTKGVTLKDAFDAIHKQFKKRVSLSFPLPLEDVLTGSPMNNSLTMNWTSPTWLASSGTRKRTGRS
jgi:hypothetical protein